MKGFYRYETVDIPLVFTPNEVLEGYQHIVVSIAQDNVTKVNKTEESLEIDTTNNKIIVPLSQEETGMFIGGDKNNPKKAKIQVNIYYNNAERDVSTVGTLDVYDNLYKKVMPDD